MNPFAITMKFTVHNSVNEQFYFNLKDADGRKLLTSKNYHSLTDCTNEIYRMQQYKDFELEDDPQMAICCYRFSLKTKSGNIIAKSPKYDSLNHMRHDKRQISSELVKATVEDHSATVRFFRPAVKY